MLELSALVFACESPERLCAFWAAVLGYEREGDVAVDPTGEVPRLVFRRAPKTKTIEVPIHLDVNAVDPDAEVARVLGLGAHLVARKTNTIGELSESWAVLRDPEGNGFCLQGPDTRRAETYLGNVTFSAAEPRVLGRFWREALGYEETPFPEELRRSLLDAGVDPAEFEAYDDARHPGGRRPRLLFQRRQKTPASNLPLHLHLATDDLQVEVDRLLELGAERVRHDPGHAVLRDADGNGFCVYSA